MAKRNNNRPYNNREYKNYNNRNRKNTTNNYKRDWSKTNNLETTTRIRIDDERINDSESLDTSFLEGRTGKNVSNNTKAKEKILKEKNVKSKEVNYTLLKNFYYVLGTLCVVILILLTFWNNNLNKGVKEVNNKKKVEVVEKEERQKVIDDNYLFVGDFNTDAFPFSKFDLDYHYVKESKSGYTTKDVLDDMRSKIYIFNPSIVFIQLGINDLSNDVSNSEIVSNLEEIIKGIKKNRPYAEIYVESVYPINKDVDDYDDKVIDEDIDNKDIIDLNKEIEKMVKKEKVNYLDIFSELSEDSKLKDNYTTDGVHLSEDGYKRIIKTINEVLDVEI